MMRSSISILLGVWLCVACAALFPAPVAAAPTFPELPYNTASFGAVLCDGFLYVYGGNSGKAHEFHRESIRGDFLRLRIAGGTAWETLPGGAGLLSPSLVSYGGKIIRIGGLSARNTRDQKKDLHSTAEVTSFDPATERWEALPPLPEPRSSHDAAILDDVLYVGGGWNLSGDDGEGTRAAWHSTLLCLNLRAPQKGWRSIAQPFERRAIALVGQGHRLWFLGGMDSDDEVSQSVDWFEPETGAWGKGPDLPKGPMSGFGMAGCVLGTRLLASPLSGQILELTSPGSRWEEVAKLQPARFFHRLLALDPSRVVAVGGTAREGHVRALEVVALSEKSGVAADPGAQWPQWRGPQRDGVAVESPGLAWPAEGPRLLFRVEVGAGMSSPVIADGRLIAHGNDGAGQDTVFAFDALTGAPLWQHAFASKSAAHEMPIVPNGPGATPTVSDGRVFALGREGDLECLELASGNEIWRRQLVGDLGGKRPVYGYTQSPLVEDDRLLLDVGAEPGAPGSTLALDVADGHTLWRSGTGEAGYSSARVLERDGRRFIAMFKGEGLDLFDPADGRVLWSHRTTTRDFCNAMTPVFAGSRILVSNTGPDGARLLEWDLAESPTVREVWVQKQFAILFNNPILHEGHFFGFNEKRSGHVEFTCLDAATGESRWVSDAVPVSTFILARDHWIFLSRAGEVLIAPADKNGLSPVRRFQALEGKCYATPALVEGRLYVRNNAGQIAVFDLRTR